MEEKFFTTEQVANILQVHPFTILKFIKVGKLKGLKLGRVYRIKESDVKDFIENMMTAPRQKKPRLEAPDPVEARQENPAQQEPQMAEKETFELISPNQQEKKDKEHYYTI